MRRTFLKSKIHRAHVTAADLHYEGSITIDRRLLDAAAIDAYELVQVVDVTNGARLETYAIPGGPGEIQINGAAAHLVDVGDLVIVMSWAELEPDEIAGWTPTVIVVDERNRPERASLEPVGARGTPA